MASCQVCGGDSVHILCDEHYSGWIPVDRELPEDFKKVWVLTNESYIWIASYSTNPILHEDKWKYVGYPNGGNIVAWQPLVIPQLPEDTDE